MLASSCPGVRSRSGATCSCVGLLDDGTIIAPEDGWPERAPIAVAAVAKRHVAGFANCTEGKQHAVTEDRITKEHKRAQVHLPRAGPRPAHSCVHAGSASARRSRSRAAPAA